MAYTTESIQKFLETTCSLWSFPLFCAYLAMIVLSPIYQRVTSPLQMRPILIIHNFACSAASLYAMLGLLYGLSQSESTFQKGPSELMIPFFRIYWITKLVELLDTVFMMLRHRRRQISFLHVYHHCSMLLLSDVSYNLYPWPCIAFYLAINCFVHIVLYLYYGLSATFPDKSFPWKKHITQLQLLQFFIGFVHATIGHIYHGFCIYGIFYGMSMTILFSNFYYIAYVKGKNPSKSHQS
ncbi:elongation of very long chain fatty acids protein 5-like [Mizuhopecten yessoensis]|uniref:Elongation of very long chain fatty acids protein n=1 Tax=Mizuhopecten yessoensis TaxID=6573 RepID=A0A210PDK9_MIZYE|nr:elongation of very long chain fatty acids protein 5-like [Mizuhopecten yessoensis]XP_021358376.1 elongation of very long chain fatty acids protein 5-like [Mizuhopecten yessoensis]OWF34562.1 Elongation of very long chain fatty acids protein 5 [Mizuhopecten yessoensis]OWF47971.1 Elongation of very long chain fatty acids protein 5 [Mizuhopecten yessoensis]